MTALLVCYFCWGLLCGGSGWLLLKRGGRNATT